ncbi:MAG: hypothetical protein JXA03_14115 [Bacteroidales bacterium]|nr:hypothetical protein [Bacteroidales bacterium]
MKTHYFTPTLALFLGLLMFASCEYDFVEPAPLPPLPEPGDTTSFALEVAPIFETDACISCHNGGIEFDLTAENAYSSIASRNLAVPFKPEESAIYTYPHPQTGEHSAKYKSNAHVNTIFTWIMQGALDN